MKIKILTIGKLKENYLREAVAEFLKRLKVMATIEILELKEVSPGKTFSKERAVQQEGEQILKQTKDQQYTIALDEKGKEFSSKEFSVLLKKFKDSGQTVTFIIGGAFGLDEEVKKRANLIFSMSKMTFTHQMVRVFLLEQIYRGLSIILGKEYHNE